MDTANIENVDPRTPTQNKPAHNMLKGSITTSKSPGAKKHKCPCKWRGAPICTCKHKKGCRLAHIPATSHPSPAASSPWKYGKYVGRPNVPSSVSGSGAFARTPRSPIFPSVPTTPVTPVPRPSAYEMGYDGSMSLSPYTPTAVPTVVTPAVAPTAAPFASQVIRTDAVSVITPLPIQVTRVFGGRVTKRKPRPKDIKIPKAGDENKSKPCICDLACDCVCITQKSPVALRKVSFFDKEMIR